MGLLPRETTKFIYELADGARSPKQRRMVCKSLKPEMVGKKYGSRTIISDEVQRRNTTVYVQTKCDCGKVEWVAFYNVTRGKGKGCLTCMGAANRVSPNSPVLGRRYDAIVARCRQPLYRGYKDYGGRGIELRFNSRSEFILWVETNLPHKDYKDVEIDRIDNNGHYEAGNLRLAGRRVQMENRRNSRYTAYSGKPVWVADAYHVIRTIDPTVLYAPVTIRNLAKAGLTVEEIINRFHHFPSCKPKGRTTLPTPDTEIASRYLGY